MLIKRARGSGARPLRGYLQVQPGVVEMVPGYTVGVGACAWRVFIKTVIRRRGTTKYLNMF